MIKNRHKMIFRNLCRYNMSSFAKYFHTTRCVFKTSFQSPIIRPISDWRDSRDIVLSSPPSPLLNDTFSIHEYQKPVAKLMLNNEIVFEQRCLHSEHWNLVTFRFHEILAYLTSSLDACTLATTGVESDAVVVLRGGGGTAFPNTPRETAIWKWAVWLEKLTDHS